MIVRFHQNFERQYKKLRTGEKNSFKGRFGIFIQDEFNPVLNNHPLKGKYQGYRSINIAGDLRAIYRKATKNIVIFVTIGSHSQLYR